MPDRHRHDEFIWALIFSLIINLLFVAALLAPYYDKKSSGLHPFFVSLAVHHQSLPAKSHALPGPTAIPAPVKREKVAEFAATIPALEQNDFPPLPAQDNAEELTGSLQPETTDLSPSAATGEGEAATTTEEISGGLSIFGDKTAGDNYTAPEYLVGEKPPYPKRAERNGWAGTVLLNLSINAKGEVEKVGIAKSSGYKLLDQQARQSVSVWRFKPARRNGHAIAVTVQQPIIFRPTPPEKVQ